MTSPCCPFRDAAAGCARSVGNAFTAAGINRAHRTPSHATIEPALRTFVIVPKMHRAKNMPATFTGGSATTRGELSVIHLTLAVTLEEWSCIISARTENMRRVEERAKSKLSSRRRFHSDRSEQGIKLRYGDALLLAWVSGSFFCAPRIFIAARHTCRIISA